MSLRALRRHRHLPAAAALMSVLLYTALVTSHIVSQATQRALPAQALILKLSLQAILAATIRRLRRARTGSEPRPSGSPAKEMSVLRGICGSAHQPRRRFCQLSCRSRLSPNAVAGFGDGQLISSANLPSWHPRAPPTLG